MARYDVTYQRDHHHFRQVTPKRIFETSYTAPQLPLPGVDPSAWPLAIELPQLRRRRRFRHRFLQQPLFSPQDLISPAAPRSQIRVVYTTLPEPRMMAKGYHWREDWKHCESARTTASRTSGERIARR